MSCHQHAEWSGVRSRDGGRHGWGTRAALLIGWPHCEGLGRRRGAVLNLAWGRIEGRVLPMYSSVPLAPPCTRSRTVCVSSSPRGHGGWRASAACAACAANAHRTRPRAARAPSGATHHTVREELLELVRRDLHGAHRLEECLLCERMLVQGLLLALDPKTCFLSYRFPKIFFMAAAKGPPRPICAAPSAPSGP